MVNKKLVDYMKKQVRIKRLNKEMNVGLIKEIMELKKDQKLKFQFYDWGKKKEMVLKVEDLT